MLERKTSRVKVWHVKDLRGHILVDLIRTHVIYGSTVYTDAYKSYADLRWYYKHRYTHHGREEYVNKEDPSNNTQSIENFWSTWKPRMKGVYRHVSSKYLQNYANEYAWRYSHRKDVCMFWSLMGCIIRT